MKAIFKDTVEKIQKDYLGVDWKRFNRYVDRLYDRPYGANAGMYYSQLAPCSYRPFISVSIDLAVIKNTQNISFVPYLFVRDGLFTLLNFFDTFSTPEDVDTVLIIHENLASIIPEAWQNNVIYFRFHLSPVKKNNLERHSALIVKGILTESFFSLDFFERQMKLLLEKHDFEKIVFCFTAKKNDIFSYGKREDEHQAFFRPEVFNCIAKAAGDRAIFVDWEELQDMPLSKTAVFVDLNEKLVNTADDYTSNYLISKSCLPVTIQRKTREIAEDEFFIRISPEHGIVLSDRPCVEEGMLNEKISKMKKIFKYEPGKLFKSDFRFALLGLFRENQPDHYWNYSGDNN